MPDFPIPISGGDSISNSISRTKKFGCPSHFVVQHDVDLRNGKMRMANEPKTDLPVFRLWKMADEDKEPSLNFSGTHSK